MTVLTSLDAARLRVARALSSARGAFDLPSIITGVVVVAILAGGVFAAVFGVIPFAQDHGAKQDLAAVRTAEGVAKAKDGAYVSGAALDGSGYLSARTGLAVGADEAGSCWVGFARSGAGTVFYATDEVMDPLAYTAGTDAGCLTAEEQGELLADIAAVTAEPQAPAEGEATASPEPTPSSEPAAQTVYAAAWGYNADGQRGDGTKTNNLTPSVMNTTGILSGKTITSISGGHGHACALAEGKAYCWGSNLYGRLGDGSGNDSTVPVAVSTAGVLAGKTITAISTGFGSHTCVVASGRAYCWGYNVFGELGNGTKTASPIPVAVSTSGALAGRAVTAISTGFDHTCAIADGKTYCWGMNMDGQLGNNSTTDSSVPVAVSTGSLPGTTITAISAGNYHTCVMASGKPYCWGKNSSGQLGRGNTTMSATPVAVTTSGVLSGKTIASISSGSGDTCVLASGKTYCWGSNNFGQFGNGGTANSSVPVAALNTGPLAGKTISSIASGGHHTCVLMNGKPYCSGRNNYGQLGNGTTADSATPVAVFATGDTESKTATKIWALTYHSAALYP